MDEKFLALFEKRPIIFIENGTDLNDIFTENEGGDSSNKMDEMNDYIGGTVILGRPETKGLARSTVSSFGGT